jgi:hypothetical protein
MSTTGPADCERRDTASAYLLGSLPDSEYYAFEVHLAGCAVCQRDVRELSSAVDMLGTAVPMVPAPPELGARIRRIVRAEAELLHAAGPEADRPPAPAPQPVASPPSPPRSRRRWVPRVAIAGAVAIGVACGLVIGSSVVGTSTPQTRAINAAILQPGVPLDARATLHVTGDRGTLSLTNFPSPPAGRVYEVWLEGSSASPRPTDALFSVNTQGSGTVAVPGSLRGVREILVTAEPLGGSLAPTRKPILAASTTA